MEYRRPFLRPGEDHRPMLPWPRQIPLDGSPPDVTAAVTAFSGWLRTSPVPKLWIEGDPGFIAKGRFTAFFADLSNQVRVTVPGGHFLQETSGPAIGTAVADFVRRLRA